MSVISTIDDPLEYRRFYGFYAAPDLHFFIKVADSKSLGKISLSRLVFVLLNIYYGVFKIPHTFNLTVGYNNNGYFVGRNTNVIKCLYRTDKIPHIKAWHSLTVRVSQYQTVFGFEQIYPEYDGSDFVLRPIFKYHIFSQSRFSVCNRNDLNVFRTHFTVRNQNHTS